MDRGREIEIKLPLESAAEGRAKLIAAGFGERHERCLERNTLFDDGERSLRQRGDLVRVRLYGEKVVLTYKQRGQEEAGTIAGSLHKHRPEQETEVGAEGPLVAVLGAAGLEPVLRYEKYRTVFNRPGESGLAMLDETPIGVYLELEGQPEWIDRVAGELGFGVGQYVTQSYLSLHQQFCLNNGVDAAEMLFDETEASEKAPNTRE